MLYQIIFNGPCIAVQIGDIPEAEVKPPDNVLFVCKLNPVTEDEDLHTIFSRFGTVVSADVIRDFKTGDSLCYAFIGE
jgi:peptidyl-prolyl cis-trans isomerase-like 4